MTMIMMMIIILIISVLSLIAFSTVSSSFYFFRLLREIYTLTFVIDPSQLVPLRDSTKVHRSKPVSATYRHYLST
jgi:hypothetical protein